MDTERKRRAVINVIYYVMIIGFFYLFLKYAFWLFFPVLLALFVALVLQKPVNLIAKKTPIKKGIASVVCVLILIFVFGGIIALIGASLVGYLKNFTEYIKGLFSNTDVLIENIRTHLIAFAGKFPDSISKMLSSSINDLFSKFGTMPGAPAAQTVAEGVQSGAGSISFDISSITSWLSTPLTSVVSTAMQIPTILLNVLITIIMCCFLTADFDKVTAFLAAQLSEKRQKDLSKAKHLLKTSFVKIIRAYSLIILITFIEMLIGLTVLKLIGVYKSSYIVIIAAVTAIVDMLPVLGTGTILLPWAAYSAITGSYGLAIGLLILYAIMWILRQIIEPKLVAGQLGLPPFITIVGMFFGLKIFGFIGMIIMPVLLIMLKLLNDEGIIHIWKSPEKSVPVPAAEKDENAGTEEAEKPDEKTE